MGFLSLSISSIRSAIVVIHEMCVARDASDDVGLCHYRSDQCFLAMALRSLSFFFFRSSNSHFTG